jgi:hypothetical protein
MTHSVPFPITLEVTRDTYSVIAWPRALLKYGVAVGCGTFLSGIHRLRIEWKMRRG